MTWSNGENGSFCWRLVGGIWGENREQSTSIGSRRGVPLRVDASTFDKFHKSWLSLSSGSVESSWPFAQYNLSSFSDGNVSSRPSSEGEPGTALPTAGSVSGTRTSNACKRSAVVWWNFVKNTYFAAYSLPSEVELSTSSTEAGFSVGVVELRIKNAAANFRGNMWR